MAVLTLALMGGSALGQVTPVYQEDFSSDPGWTTNNATNYHWDSVTETYYARQVDGSDEFAYRLLPELNVAGDWRVEYDIKPGSNSSAGNRRLSLTSSDMLVGTMTWGMPFVTVDFNNVGNQIQLLWNDSEGNHSYIHVAPNGAFSEDVWYNTFFEWDSTTGTLSAGVTERDTGQLLGEDSVTGLGSFDGIDRIAMSTLGDSLGGEAQGYFDNIVVLPEPTALFLLAFGSLLLVRRRQIAG
jgi:hypothetical protein